MSQYDITEVLRAYSLPVAHIAADKIDALRNNAISLNDLHKELYDYLSRVETTVDSMKAKLEKEIWE